MSRIFLIIFISVIGAGSLPFSAQACEPPPLGTHQQTISEAATAAAVVFEGTITKCLKYCSRSPQQVEVTVVRYFKGDGPMRVSLDGFGSGPDCLPFAQMGGHFIFFPQSGDVQKGLCLVNSCDPPYPLEWGARLLEQVEPNTIGDIIKAVGHPPQLPKEFKLPWLQ